MKNDFSRWQRLFLFCLGLLIAGAFAMKWMESDLLYNNEKISIFGLELFYPKEKIIEIFTGINDKVRTILGYHLSFDFIFMAGVYPGILVIYFSICFTWSMIWGVVGFNAFTFLKYSLAARNSRLLIIIEESWR